MKTFLIFSILMYSLLLTTPLFAQLLFEENFDYSTGTLTTVTTNWSESPTGSTDVQILSGNLSYANYPSSNLGKKINLNGGATGRSGIIRNFPTQSTAGTTVYWSFLLKVTSTTDMDLNSSTGDYFANFRDISLSNAIRSAIHVRQGSNSDKYQIGIYKASTTTLSWYSTELDITTTYLIVTAYSFISGSDNDVVKLWINPDLSGSEPTPDISINSGADLNDLGYIQFRQNQKSGDMDIDGIRVATSWNQAPLPVELINFNIFNLNKSINLKWSTSTETQNYGWEIERSQIDKSTNRPSAWQVIGFVKGAGNSNSPKEYSFVDYTALYGQYAYRLKQIDIDGTTSYSDELRVFVGNKPQVYDIKAFPNPFNPTTTIRFELPKAGNVKLEVYDLLGRLVSVLVDEYLEEGIYQKEFDGSKLTSGIYFCVLHANGQKIIRKMQLIK